MEETGFLINSIKNKISEFRQTALTLLSEENKTKDKTGKLNYLCYLLVSFLTTFKENRQETLSILKKFPEVSEPVETLFDIPTCPCRYRAIDFITKNISNEDFFNTISELIDKQDANSLLSKHAHLEGVMKNSSLLCNDDLFLPGKKIRIPNTPEAYLDKMIELGQGYSFKGMNMYKVENDEYLDLYFY
jgi:hypothetical protein